MAVCMKYYSIVFVASKLKDKEGCTVNFFVVVSMSVCFLLGSDFLFYFIFF